MKKLKAKKHDFKHYEAYCFMNGLKPGRLSSLLKYQSYIKALKY
jgi:hypothetical protein